MTGRLSLAALHVFAPLMHQLPTWLPAALAEVEEDHFNWGRNIAIVKKFGGGGRHMPPVPQWFLHLCLETWLPCE